jgi:hypothetical protein
VERPTEQGAGRLGDALLGADEGRALETGEVVVGAGVELDQDGEQLGRLGAGGLLEGPGALAGLGRLGLERAQLLGRRREAGRVLAVEGVRLGQDLGAGGELGVPAPARSSLPSSSRSFPVRSSRGATGL